VQATGVAVSLILGKGGLRADLCVGAKQKRHFFREIKSKNFHYLMNWAAQKHFSLIQKHTMAFRILFLGADMML
jgi:hypothetical protein